MSTAAQDVLAGRAQAYADLAVANVTRPYPYFPTHLLQGPDELLPPSTRHPAFYGAYDWHSSVHMHWLLVRLLRRYGTRFDTAAGVATLDAHLTPANVAAEADYLRSHPSFERPYGWAWLLALAAECRALGDAAGSRWSDALAPATAAVADLLQNWLGKATYPVRHGVHSNSAFALGLVLDSAEQAGHPELLEPVTAALHRWFAEDHTAPVHWEPSGQDFLSPSLTEADAMRRILTREHFAAWLSRFLPGLSEPLRDGTPFEPPVVSDPTDPQIGHLIGLSLSRAAAFHGIAAGLPADDRRIPGLAAAAEAHLAVALPATDSGDFTTDHWLATFAVLALDEPLSCG
ncbi:DUF2891 domain-containing protein [Peterkaempfera sp. SMS 1(5)a]|uniref:DUF2891 domain-containing protein n=1 Tax=Peterkaempfera podocarpi TaxID=3232308 RepID=UPI00366E34C0